MAIASSDDLIWILKAGLQVITMDFVSLRRCTPWLHSAGGLHVAQHIRKKDITCFPAKHLHQAHYEYFRSFG